MTLTCQNGQRVVAGQGEGVRAPGHAEVVTVARRVEWQEREERVHLNKQSGEDSHAQWKKGGPPYLGAVGRLDAERRCLR